jgi:hypothetical protein
MSKDSNEGNSGGPGKSPASVLILTIADTTWRMFVPTVGGLLLGRMADEHWLLSPFGMIAGVVIGAVVTAVLIKRQLESKG